MPEVTEERQLRERMHRIDTLLQEVEAFKDPKAQAKTREIVQGLMQLHGTVLERLLDHVTASQLAGTALIDSLAQDDLIASLLLLYGLHPLDLETRVRQALDEVRPYLHSHGGNVELLSIDDGVVRLRLQGSCHGCPSSAATLKSTIEEAITEKAPDAAAIDVEGESSEPIGQDAGHSHFALPVLAG